MSALFINRNAHLMMLEVGVEKLFVPSTCPFDNVVSSKYIVSFRFLDDEWIDINPKRLDYQEYHGSVGDTHCFNGGKSVVFTMTESSLTEESEDLAIEVKAVRQISKYFEKNDCHVSILGCLRIVIDDLFNNIVEELRLRDELEGYLNVIHKSDPISMSTKSTFKLNEEPGSNVTLYIRLSHLGDCLIAEIDIPYDGPTKYFYGQEHMNRDAPYEFCELEPPGKPRRDLPFPKPLDNCAVQCTCTDDQRNRRFAKDNNSFGLGGEDKKFKKKKKKKKSDDDDSDKRGNKQKGTGIVTVGITDKPRSSQPICSVVCIPCEPCVTYDPCSPGVCLTTQPDTPCAPVPIGSYFQPICCEN